MTTLLKRKDLKIIKDCSFFKQQCGEKVQIWELMSIEVYVCKLEKDHSGNHHCCTKEECVEWKNKEEVYVITKKGEQALQ